MKLNLLRSALLGSALLLGARWSLAADWPQWRGPNRDGLSQETGLLKEWPEEGPPVLWQVDTAGVAYSSVVVKDGRLVTQGDVDGVEHILAYDEKTGQLLWAVQPEPVALALTEKVDSQFKNFDKDENGQLDELEALAALGWDFPKFDTEATENKAAVTAARVEFLFAKLDKDEDGNLSYSELPGPIQGNFDKLDAETKGVEGLALAEERAAKLVERDEDLDAKLSRQEAKGTVLERLFDKIDEKVEGTDKGDGQLTAAEMQKYFFAREPGRDGVLSKAELVEYYGKNQAGKDGVLVKADIRRFFGGYRNGYGDGPRGTPTIDGDHIYAEGGNGDLTCLEAATGRTIWHRNLVTDFKGGRPGWGFCESPLVVDDYVVVTPGGKDGTLAVLSKETGELVWRSTDVTQGAHYASPQVAEIGGIRQIVQFANSSVFGVKFDDGKPLWSYSNSANGTANIATPIISGEYVLAASGYGKGAGLVKITTLSSTEQSAEEVYFQPKLANHHGGIVKVGDYVYGFGGALVCMNFLTGEIAWQNRSVGKCSLTYADGMLYCLSEGYEVGLVEATPEEYREHGRFKIESFGRQSWAHPVVANGKLLIRNLQRLAAYDVRAQ